MSDFVQMMKDWSRICNSVPGKSECKSLCSDKESGYVCPLRNNGLCSKTIASLTDKDIISGENIITAWAAEHPEPVYPTWAEWLIEQGLAEHKTVFSHEYHTDALYVTDFDTALKETVHTPIPANIAEKLGLKPKERKNDV